MRPPFNIDGPPACTRGEAPPSARLKRAGHRTGMPRQRMARARLSPSWLWRQERSLQLRKATSARFMVGRLRGPEIGFEASWRTSWASRDFVSRQSSSFCTASLQPAAPVDARALSQRQVARFDSNTPHEDPHILLNLSVRSLASAAQVVRIAADLQRVRHLRCSNALG